MNQFDKVLIVMLFAVMAIAGMLALEKQSETTVVATSKEIPLKLKPVNDTRENRILSDLMDQTIGACYYETYQLNDTVISGTADSCDKAMMSYKQVCKIRHIEACNSEFFKKYLRGMEG